jgi:hypothetical protein
MKYLFLLIIGFLGFYAYSNFSSTPKNDFDPTDSKMLFKHLINGGEVSTSEVITASVSTAKFFCNDASYQVAGGHTVASCHDKLKSFETACTQRIFADKDKIYSDKDEVSKLFKRFVSCVGT